MQGLHAGGTDRFWVSRRISVFRLVSTVILRPRCCRPHVRIEVELFHTMDSAKSARFLVSIIGHVLVCRSRRAAYLRFFEHHRRVWVEEVESSRFLSPWAVLLRQASKCNSLRPHGHERRVRKERRSLRGSLSRSTRCKRTCRWR